MLKNMKSRLYVRADDYSQNPSRFDRMSQMTGQDICTVDLNNAYVCPKEDKFGMNLECGEYTEQNLQERFGLTTPEGQGDY